MDLENWMGCIKDTIEDKKLSEIVIPGSHDSASYCINYWSKKTVLLPDLGPLNFIMRLVGVPWSKTQLNSIADQLKMGVRYIDLRVILDKDTDTFFMVHGFESAPLLDELRIIADFILKHPSEVLILDMNHIYQCDEEDIVRILTIFEDLIGDQLCPAPQEDTSVPTYKELLTSRTRVIVALSEKPEYFMSSWRHPELRQTFPWLWSSEDNVVSPWANTMDTGSLYTFLKTSMSEYRRPDSFHVCQTILSAQSSDTIAGIFRPPRSVKQVSQILNPLLPDWYQEFNASYKLNITIVDFITPDIITLLVNLNLPPPLQPCTAECAPLMGYVKGGKQKKKKKQSFLGKLFKWS